MLSSRVTEAVKAGKQPHIQKISQADIQGGQAGKGKAGLAGGRAERREMGVSNKGWPQRHGEGKPERPIRDEAHAVAARASDEVTSPSSPGRGCQHWPLNPYCTESASQKEGRKRVPLETDACNACACPCKLSWRGQTHSGPAPSPLKQKGWDALRPVPSTPGRVP